MKKNLKYNKEHYDIVINIVKDIIYIFNNGQEGNYFLPEDIDGDEMTYVIDDIDFNVELNIRHDQSYNQPYVDGGYYHSEQTIEFDVIYNPENVKEHYDFVLYQVVDILRHEIEHMFQEYRGTKFKTPPKKSLKYYLQDHELDSQVWGIFYLSLYRDISFKDAMEYWFRVNSNLHKLTDEEEIIVKNALVDRFNRLLT